MPRSLALAFALLIAACPPVAAQTGATNALPLDPAAPSAGASVPRPGDGPATTRSGLGAFAPTTRDPGSAGVASEQRRSLREGPRARLTDLPPEQRRQFTAERRARLRERLAQLTPEQRQAVLDFMRERRAARRAGEPR